MQSIKFRISGVEPLILNNPRTVDPFDKYAKLKKVITSKRSKTDDDLLELRRLEVESKLYFDDSIGVYIPGRWLLAAIAKNSFAQVKISKEKARGSVFITDSKIPLKYSGQKKVKNPADVAGNPEFIITMNLPQKGVRLSKCFPVFHDWSFETELEFDHSIINERDLVKVLQYSSNYGGFGDFRPTYGRALFKKI
jgi:hypothetical protein